MYIDNENFEKWMEKLSKKLTVIGQDLKSLINTDTVLPERFPARTTSLKPCKWSTFSNQASAHIISPAHRTEAVHCSI